jgi:glycosyltransferase involved in cell wall biosynthesis
MKIGIYNDWWNPDLVGGAERSALSIYEEIIGFFGRDQVLIFTLSNRLRSKKISSSSTGDVRCIGSFTLRKRYLVPTYIRIFERARILVDFVTPYRVARAISKNKVDILVVHNMDRLGLKFLVILNRIFKIRLIRIVHDLSDMCVNRKRFRNKKNCKKTCLSCKPKTFFYKLIMLGSYELVIFNSKFSLDKFKSLKFKAKEMNYGYTLPKIDSHKNTVTKRVANPKKIRIGYVGRVSPEKGLELIIKALQILQSSSNCTVKLIIIGAGTKKYISSLDKFAQESSVRLEMYGFKDNPYNFIRSKIDLIVIPSIWEETFGRVAFEASAAGFPVLLSRIGGLSESASLAGNNYFEFEPSDSFDLARQISTFYVGNNRGVLPIVNDQRIADIIVRKILEFNSIELK